MTLLLSSRPIFRRKLSDIQVPSFSTVTTSNQLINNCIGLVSGANSSANTPVPSSNNLAYYENNMVPSAISNPGTNNNSSFDSDTNFDSTGGSNAKYLNQSYSPALPQFQTMLSSHGSAASDSFTPSNSANSPSMMPYSNSGVGMLGNSQMMNHLSTENSGNISQPVSVVNSSSSERYK